MKFVENSRGLTSKFLIQILAVYVIPIVLAVVFLCKYASPLPHWDEWFYIKHVVQMMNLSIINPSEWSSILNEWPVNFRDHKVVIPFVFYWPIMELFHYDSRWVVGFSILVFVLQTLFYGKYLGKFGWSWFPVVLVALSLSHYMEFVWAWQITISMSITFAIGGIWYVSNAKSVSGHDEASSYPVFSVKNILFGIQLLMRERVIIGYGLMVFSFLSSTSGIFAFLVAVPLLGFSTLSISRKVSWIFVFIVTFGFFYESISAGVSANPMPGLRNVSYIAYAIGAYIFSCYEGTYDTQTASYLIVGFVFFVVFGFEILLVLKRKIFHSVSLPLGCILFGLMCMYSVSVTRDYLGNWHLQHLTPVFCGVYMLGYKLLKLKSDWKTLMLFCLSVMFCLMTVAGTWRAFDVFGPIHEKLMNKRVDGFLNHLMEPSQDYLGLKKAFGVGDDEILFLLAKNHTVFGINSGWNWEEVEMNQIRAIWLDDKLLDQSLTVEGKSSNWVLMTVLLNGNEMLSEYLRVTIDERSFHLALVKSRSFDFDVLNEAEMVYRGFVRLQNDERTVGRIRLFEREFIQVSGDQVANY